MRPLLFTPERVTVQSVQNCLASAGSEVSAEAMKAWIETELWVAADWAVRENLNKNDNRVKRRSKPSFVTDAELLTRALASRAPRPAGAGVLPCGDTQ